MANSEIYRGYVASGVINLKQDDGTSPENVLPYVIPGGAVVEIVFPQDSTQPSPTAVILSSATTLPSPLIGNEVTIVNASQGQISFVATRTKTALMGLGNNQAVDVRVVKDPSTMPTPVNVDFFEALKVINIKDPSNQQS